MFLDTPMNLCTSVLPKFSFNDAVDIAVQAGYEGIELRVNGNYHKSLEDLDKEGCFLRRKLERTGLSVPVLNSYLPVDDEGAVDRLLQAAQKMGVPKVRLVLPRGCQASVSRRAHVKEIIPSYEAAQEPQELMGALRKTLRQLERKAYKAGVKVLLELHWGTVMSSFSSAYFLVNDLDPECIAVTFDPANMMVEGKEDWEFGIKLIGPHLANVHVKNMNWKMTPNGWAWAWAPLSRGMVDWYELISLLAQNRYSGDYAMEDFLVPNGDKESAIAYLTKARSEFRNVYACAANQGRRAVS